MTARAPRIAIIGAGMAGVTCARLLGEAGYRPTIFEKGRGIGGRLSTRRGTSPQGLPLAFDHGAQYITAKTPGFAAELEAAYRAGTAALWQAAGLETAGPTRCYVGQPGMNAPLKLWLHGPARPEVRLGCEIASVTRDGPAWRLGFADGTEPALFDFVICTAPAPQAAQLVAEDKTLCRAFAEVEIAPCWALMFALAERLEPGFDAHVFDGDQISWMARNNAKPGRSRDLDCWVVHAAPDWSRLNLELSKRDAARALMDASGEALGYPLPEPVVVSAHRWRYARTLRPLGAPYLASVDETLFVGGDWCLGARAEDAYLSGHAMAKAALQSISLA